MRNTCSKVNEKQGDVRNFTNEFQDFLFPGLFHCLDCIGNSIKKMLPRKMRTGLHKNGTEKILEPVSERCSTEKVLESVSEIFGLNLYKQYHLLYHFPHIST